MCTHAFSDTLTKTLFSVFGMRVADQIRKRGFRRWHERQLIEAHASLVTAFLSLILIAVCLDQLDWRGAGVKPLVMLALIAAGVALCFKTVTFYFSMLFRAEHFALQAVCSECKVYGVIDVLATHNEDVLQVCCKKCHHPWTIHAQEIPPAAGKSL